MGFKSEESRDKNKKTLVDQYELGLAQNSLPYFDQYEFSDIADWYASVGKFKTAQEVLDYGFRIHPESTILLVEQAYLYLDLSKIQEAKSVINVISEENDIDVILLKGEIYLNEGNLQDAEKEFSKLDQADFDDIDVAQNVAKLFLTMGYPENSIKWMSKDINKYSDNDEYVALLAECYYQDNDNTEKAVYYYNKLIDKHPYNSSYWLSLAKTYSKLEQYDSALEAIDFALVSEDNYGEAYYLKANAYFQLDNMELAIEYYDKAIEYFGISPDYGFTFIAMANISKAEWQEAIDAYTKAYIHAESIEKKDINLLSDIYSNIGLCYSKLNKFTEAIEMCKKALEYGPENPYIHIIDGQVKLLSGDHKEAQESWKKAYEILPDIDVYMQIASFLYETGYIDASIYYAEMALEAKGDHTDVYNHIISCCITSQNAEKFCKYGSKATPAISASDICYYIENLYPNEKEAYAKFIEQVKTIAKLNS